MRRFTSRFTTFNKLRFRGHHKLSKYVYPAVVGAAVYLAYPGLVAYQDMAALLPEPIKQRWLAHMPEGPGESVQTASVHAVMAATTAAIDPRQPDPLATGSIKAETVREDALAGRVTAEIKTRKDPERINRSGKGSRVVSTTLVKPPEGFSAGSVLQRQSMLGDSGLGEEFELAFVEPMGEEEAIQVASVFHQPTPKGPKVADDLPVMVASLVEESAGNILSYSAEPKIVRSPFAAVLNDEEPYNLIPRLGKDDHDWADDPLPLASFGEKQQDCLARGIYFEARGEPVRGQAAVAQVILNRVKNPKYPDSICGVVYQNKKWRNRCQFSFACDRIKDTVRDRKRFDIAKYVARETTEGRIWLSEVGSSTHYHATYVRPKWARYMKKVGRIGLHVFYRTYGGGWS